MTESQVTELDVQTLAEQLEVFGATLAPGQRAALAALVNLAARGAQDAAPTDVTGHMMMGEFTAVLLAEARHREDLATAERARLVAAARTTQSAGESVWDRLRRGRGPAAEGTTAPRLQPAAGAASGS